VVIFASLGADVSDGCVTGRWAVSAADTVGIALSSDRSKIVNSSRDGGGKNPPPEIVLACTFALNLVVPDVRGPVDNEGDCGADGAGRAVRYKSAASSSFDLRSLASVSEDTSSEKPLG